MLMRKNILLVVCVVLLFGVSCRKADTTFSVPDFPKKGTIASNKINDTLLMTYPFEMFVTDNNIYVLAYVGGTFIQVYDKSDGHYVGSGAVMGRGPGELLAGVNMYYDSKSSTVSVYDNQSRKIVKYLIDEKGSDLFVFQEERSFLGLINPIRKAWPLQDSTYLVNGQVGVEDGDMGRFQMVIGDRLTGSWNSFPLDDMEQCWTFWTTATTISPDHMRFADGTLFGAILETFDVKDNRVTQRGCRMFYPPAIEYQSGVTSPTEQTVFGFTSLCSTNEYIYGVFLGSKDMNDFDNISVFDWDGREVATFDTDCNVLRICCSDSEPGRIYAIAVSPENSFYLVSFDLDI